MTDYRQAHNIAALFIDDDITGYRIQGDGLHVGYHDAEHRRQAAAFVEPDGLWTLNEINAVVSQTATVNGITVDLYSKADGVDWKRHRAERETAAILADPATLAAIEEGLTDLRRRQGGAA